VCVKDEFKRKVVEAVVVFVKTLRTFAWRETKPQTLEETLVMSRSRSRTADRIVMEHHTAHRYEAPHCTSLRGITLHTATRHHTAHRYEAPLHTATRHHTAHSYEAPHCTPLRGTTLHTATRHHTAHCYEAPQYTPPRYVESSETASRDELTFVMY
jgi:hypothetical protein